jgi:hypothetical protein
MSLSAIASRGFADLSPPEAQHAMLELPTNRAEYVGMLQDMGDYPRRSPIGVRIPSDAEVQALRKAGTGRWRVVVLLDDERALALGATYFSHLFLLDPFFDIGQMLYAAWHDPLIRDEHSRRLAEQGALLLRAAPLLNGASASLAPDHLPGSWNPRPSWRRPRPGDDPRQHAAWAMRCALVLTYWADRLDAVVCTARNDVIAALDVVLGGSVTTRALDLRGAARVEASQALREESLCALKPNWDAARQASRRRSRAHLDDVTDALASMSDSLDAHPLAPWRVSLGATGVPEPSLLLRRVLVGEDPERRPPLPPRRLRRRPLCVVSAS